MNNLTLTIADTAIRTDAEGRFCLNDLHRAAGGESRHRPHYWLENQQTKELFAELAKAGNPAIETKQGLGTYVSKELVYAYAMWISPAFNLKVIRAYDALVTQPRVKFSRMDIIKLAMESEQRAMALEGEKKALEAKTEAQQAAIDAAKPKVQFYDAFRNADGLYGLDNAARALNIPPRKFTQALYNQRFLFREGGVLVPYAEHREKGVFFVKVTMVDDKARHQTYITPKGLTYFARRFADLIQHPQLELAS